MIRRATHTGTTTAKAKTRAVASIGQVPGGSLGLTSGALGFLSGIGSAWAFRSAALLISFAESSEFEVVLAYFISREACLVR